MSVFRLAVPLAFLVLSTASGALAGTEDDLGAVTLSGIVRRPDGSPAAGAIVDSPDDWNGSLTSTRTDAAGRFRIRGMFGNMARFHARTEDGAHQGVRMLSSDTVRLAAAADPVEVVLAPAVEHTVVVLAEGRPVEGAHVVATGQTFRLFGTSGPDGQLRLRLPAHDKLDGLVAWHPKHGVQGILHVERPSQARTELSLLAPGAPLTVRAIDPDGRPVPGLELGIEVLVEGADWSSWAVASHVPAAHVRTEDNGSASVAWAPRQGLKFVNVRTFQSPWSVEEVDREALADGIVLLHVRRKVPVEGRITMPTSGNPEGLLISGFGFGPAQRGDTPYARVRADGSFTLSVVPTYGYVLGVVDREWGGELWSGQVVGKDLARPASVRMSVRRATPVTIHVTRGPQHTPVADAFVEIGRRRDVNWVDARGKKQDGSAGTRYWVTTDAQGVVRTGMASGPGEVRLGSRTWDETRTLKVPEDQPLDVEFHRPWPADRRLAGRLVVEGKPFAPSSSFVARAWLSRGERFVPSQEDVRVKADGTFEVPFDAETATVFFHDLGKQRSGYAKVEREGPIEVPMVTGATYGGTIVGEDGKPLAGYVVDLYVQGSGGTNPVATELADPDGRFHFTNAPAGVPLVVVVKDRAGREERFLSEDERKFQPGEVRDKDTLKPRRR